jgi:hypothetical protein
MAPTKGFLFPITAGHCIYCQKPSGRLTDEHFVPSGLGGVDIIPNATCGACQKITHRFETTALRHTLGPGRYWLGIKGKKGNTRRPKSWPAYRTDGDGAEHRIDIPLADFPFFMFLPKFKTGPNFREAIPSDQYPVEENGVILVSEDQQQISERLAKYGASELRATVDYLSFARMLAKIALGYCVKTFGYERFTPIVSPLILGWHNAYPNLVSSSTREHPPTQKDMLIKRGYTHEYFYQICPKTSAVDVRLDLFKNLDGPSYYVRAGILPNGESAMLQWSTDS